MRLDKWLKMARIFKGRAEAVRACDLGRVKLNGLDAKASKAVQTGDEIVVKIARHYRTLTIKEIPARGLSAKDAKLIYDERTPELSPEMLELIRLQETDERRLRRQAKGRPTKKERRNLDKWRGR